MVAKKQTKRRGLTWHMHHDFLMLQCWDYDQRVHDIKEWKPSREISTRIKYFQFVKGELPEELVEAMTTSAFGSRTINLMRKYRIAIETLHAKECPDCPWDGSELIFPTTNTIASVFGWLKCTWWKYVRRHLPWS